MKMNVKKGITTFRPFDGHFQVAPSKKHANFFTSHLENDRRTVETSLFWSFLTLIFI